MSRDSSGNYTLPAGNPVVTGTTIESTWANNTLNDVAVSLTNSLDRTGKGGMLAPLYFDDGLVSLPAISFTNEQTSGIYRNTAGDIRLSIQGIDSVKWVQSGQTINSVTSDATAGPDMTVFRNSATPAVSDQIGRFKIDGRNSGGGQVSYGMIAGVIQSPTAAAEEGIMQFSVLNTGAMTVSMQINADASVTFTNGIAAGDTTLNSLTVLNDLTVSTDALYVDSATGFVGIQNLDPIVPLHVKGPALLEDSEPVYYGRSAQNPLITDQAVLVALQGQGYSNTDVATNSASLVARASEVWSTTSAPSQVEFYTTPSGSLTTAERMRIDSAGNVGIGTNSPASQLSVSDGGNTGVEIFSAASKGNVQCFDRVGLEYEPLNLSAEEILFRTGTGTVSERMLIDAAGNVGIGTTTPSTTLDVSGSMVVGSNTGGAEGGQIDFRGTAGTGIWTMDVGAADNLRLFTTNASAGAVQIGYLAANATGNISLYTNGAERMRITSAGKVGIGTTNPVEKLDVGNGVIRVPNNLTPVNEGDGGAYFYKNAGAVINNATAVIARVNSAERMRINSSGDVLIASTVAVNAEGDTGCAIKADGTFISAKPASAATSVAAFLGNTGRAVVRGDGDLENTNNSYGGISDARLKSNIVDASPQLNDIMALNVRSYTLNSTGKKHIGVIAQELEEAGMGGLVKTDDEGMKSVKYSVLYMKAIKAIQEQQELINTLTARLDALEA